eukprot:4960337-Alexandrium_andersonii.AAC.1
MAAHTRSMHDGWIAKKAVAASAPHVGETIADLTSELVESTRGRDHGRRHGCTHGRVNGHRHISKRGGRRTGQQAETCGGKQLRTQADTATSETSQ